MENLRARDARLNAWLENVKPGDIVTVRLNSTDTLTGKVYEAPDAQGTSLCVNSTVLRHGNGYPGGSYDLVEETVDYKALLRKYIVHVGINEGSNFLMNYYRNYSKTYGLEFTDAEWTALNEMED